MLGLFTMRLRIVRNAAGLRAIPRRRMCSSASSELVSVDEGSDQQRDAVVTGLAEFLNTEKRLPPELAKAIATNASSFTMKVLHSIQRLHGRNAGAELIADRIKAHLYTMRVDKVMLFYESIGMDFERRTENELREKYQHAVAITAFLEELKVERKAVGSLLSKNRPLFNASTVEVFNLFQYLYSNSVTGDSLQILCSRFPEIFTSNMKTVWEPFLQILREYEIQEVAMRRLVKHFCFLLIDLSKLDYVSTLDYLQLDLHLEKPEVARLLKSHPEVLLLDMEKTIKAKVKFLRSHKVKHADITRIFARCPSIVGYSIDTMVQKIAHLQELGLREWNVRQILVAFPPILCHSIENKIQPTLALLKDAGIKEENLAKLVVKRPAIFAIDNKEKLPKLLEDIKDLGPEGMVLVLRWGLAEGIKHLKSRLGYLRNIGFTSEELVKMLSRDPRILKIHKVGLETKVKYLTEVMGKSPYCLVRNPTFLYSHLQRRIKLRYEVLKLLHDRGELSKEPQLCQILYPDNRVFMKRYVNPYRACVTLVRKHYRMFQRNPDGDHKFMMKYLREPPELPGATSAT